MLDIPPFVVSSPVRVDVPLTAKLELSVIPLQVRFAQERVPVSVTPEQLSVVHDRVPVSVIPEQLSVVHDRVPESVTPVQERFVQVRVPVPRLCEDTAPFAANIPCSVLMLLRMLIFQPYTNTVPGLCCVTPDWECAPMYMLKAPETGLAKL